MPFNILMTHCLENKTSWNDSPKSPSISIKPENNEKILFFSIDSDSETEHKYKFRKHYGLIGKNICDLIIYYVDFDRDIRRFIFTEIKGKELDHAHTQLETTCSAVINHPDFKTFCEIGCNKMVDIWLLTVSDSVKPSVMNSKVKKSKRNVAHNVQYGGQLPQIKDIKPSDFDRVIRA